MDNLVYSHNTQGSSIIDVRKSGSSKSEHPHLVQNLSRLKTQYNFCLIHIDADTKRPGR